MGRHGLEPKHVGVTNAGGDAEAMEKRMVIVVSLQLDRVPRRVVAGRYGGLTFVLLRRDLRYAPEISRGSRTLRDVPDYGLVGGSWRREWLYNRRMNDGLDMERFFSALADRTRLRLLNLMGNGEICVCFLVEVLRTNQPKISRHLAYLRKAGVVAARRDGKWMHYRIVRPEDPYAARILDEALSWAAADAELQRDLTRLTAACCAPQVPVRLRAAPRPTSVSVS